jgi:hypothetical protein
MRIKLNITKKPLPNGRFSVICPLLLTSGIAHIGSILQRFRFAIKYRAFIAHVVRICICRTLSQGVDCIDFVDYLMKKLPVQRRNSRPGVQSGPCNPFLTSQIRCQASQGNASNSKK